MDAYVPSISNWFDKIQLPLVENDDGTLNMVFEWDETDPDLKMWTEWGPEKQEEFILNALRSAIVEEKEASV